MWAALKLYLRQQFTRPEWHGARPYRPTWAKIGDRAITARTWRALRNQDLVAPVEDGAEVLTHRGLWALGLLSPHDDRVKHGKLGAASKQARPFPFMVAVVLHRVADPEIGVWAWGSVWNDWPPSLLASMRR